MSATLSEDDARPAAVDREEARGDSGTASVSVEPGAKVGRFLVTSQLGAGGMGVVLAAQDPLLDRKVAVKLLRPRAYGEEAAERARNRLLRELWDSKQDRKRAVELAKQTLADYEKLRAHGYRYMLRDMDDVKNWLREHGVK